MICIICAILAIIIFLVYTHFEYGIDFETALFSVIIGILGLLIGFIILLAGSAIWSGCAEPSDWTTVNHEKTELVALKDGYHIEGTAFLFSSVVNENLEYTYIYEEPELGLTTNTIKAKSAYIKYIDTDKTPYIQKWEKLMIHF